MFCGETKFLLTKREDRAGLEKLGVGDALAPIPDSKESLFPVT